MLELWSRAVGYHQSNKRHPEVADPSSNKYAWGSIIVRRDCIGGYSRFSASGLLLHCSFNVLFLVSFNFVLNLLLLDPFSDPLSDQRFLIFYVTHWIKRCDVSTVYIQFLWVRRDNSAIPSVTDSFGGSLVCENYNLQFL